MIRKKNPPKYIIVIIIIDKKHYSMIKNICQSPSAGKKTCRGRKWSPYVRIVPVRCLGSVNTIWIADAMSKGTDGCLLLAVFGREGE